MKNIELKTDPKLFELSWCGKKPFEIRFNDRNYQEGDTLHLRETKYSGSEMQAGEPLEYTGREIIVEVLSVINGYGLQEGWVNLGTRMLDKVDPESAVPPTVINPA